MKPSRKLEIYPDDTPRSLYKRYRKFSKNGELTHPGDIGNFISQTVILGRRVEKLLVEYVDQNRQALEKAEGRRRGKALEGKFDEFVETLKTDASGLDNYLAWVELSAPKRGARKLNRRASSGETILDAVLSVKNVEAVKKLLDTGAYPEPGEQNSVEAVQRAQLLLGAASKVPWAKKDQTDKVVEFHDLPVEQLQAKLFEWVGDTRWTHFTAEIGRFIMGFGERGPMFQENEDFVRANIKSSPEGLTFGDHGPIERIFELRKDLDINKVDENGETLLHKAARMSNRYFMGIMFNTLLNCGAKHIPNKAGQFPEDLAQDPIWAGALKRTRIDAEKALEAQGYPRVVRSRVSTQFLSHDQHDVVSKPELPKPSPLS